MTIPNAHGSDRKWDDNAMLRTAEEPDGRTSLGRVVPARIAHFVIRTPNVSALVAWYKEVFQAETVFDNGALAFLYFDSEHHRIAIGAIPGLKDADSSVAGIDHVAFTYSSIDDLLSTYVRLKKLDILPYYNIDHGVTTSIYYKDPDGNQIEFQVDNFPSREEAHAYFRSDAFAKNPLGVEFEPDALVARLDSGDTPSQELSPGTGKI